MLIGKPVTTWIRHARKIFIFRYHVLRVVTQFFFAVCLLVCLYAICLAGYVLGVFYHTNFSLSTPPERNHQLSDLQTPWQYVSDNRIDNVLLFLPLKQKY